MVKRKKEVEVASPKQCFVVRDLPPEPEDSILSSIDQNNSPGDKGSNSSTSRIGVGDIDVIDEANHKTPSPINASNEEEGKDGYFENSSSSSNSMNVNTADNDDNGGIGSLRKQMEYLSTTSISSPLSKEMLDSKSFVSWEQTRKELRVLLGSNDEDVKDEQYAESLEVLTFRNISKANECNEKLQHLSTNAPIEISKQAKMIHKKLEEKITMEKTFYEKENAGFLQAQKELDDAQIKLIETKQEHEQLLKRKQQLKQQIVNYKEEAAQTLEEFDEIEANMMQKVPRIKKQISLYARCTGIKWNYDNTDIYAGEVANSKQQVLRHFSIDPTELEDFEIANKIWDVIGGEDI